MPQIKAANRAAGHHWFTPDTMRFFRSRVGETTYQTPTGALFVSSERRSDSDPRLYSVREFDAASGAVGTWEDTFQAYGSARAAHAAARAAARKLRDS